MTDRKAPLDVARIMPWLRMLDPTAGEAAPDRHLLPAPAVTYDDLSAFLKLVERVNRDRPAEGDLLELDKTLTAHPGLWRLVGDLASRAIDRMIDQMSPSVGLRLSLRHAADELLSSLAGAGSSPLESALAEQIAVCWVRLRIFELTLANATENGDSVIIRFWEERVAAAQRRYLTACESMARIRRLALRTPQLFQINVAGQQINITRPAPDQE